MKFLLQLYLPVKIKMILKWLVIIVSPVLLLIVLANLWIVKTTSGKNYVYISEIPANDVGLLLGTSKYSRNGNSNMFFLNRIEAAADLYHAGKIKHIIVSGDNSAMNYNEPRDMLRALVKKGIPASAITLDFAGFRTLDSVIRSRKIFGQNKITIISQKFHNQRALFIADYYAIDAVGFCATDPSSTFYYPILIREVFARLKAVLDLYVLKQKPRFLGKKEKIILT